METQKYHYQEPCTIPLYKYANPLYKYICKYIYIYIYIYMYVCMYVEMQKYTTVF